jgi:hypothetical protein
LEVLPGWVFGFGVSQEVSGVEGWHEGNSSPGKQLASKLGDASGYIQKGSQGGVSQGDDDSRADGLKLGFQEGPADGYLLRRGSPVGRRSALDGVADIDIFSAKAHGRDHAVEELACSAHEGLALGILFSSWAFAHKDHFGSRVSDSKDNLGSAGVEAASGAAFEARLDLIQAGRGF